MKINCVVDSDQIKFFNIKHERLILLIKNLKSARDFFLFFNYFIKKYEHCQCVLTRALFRKFYM